MTDAPRLLLSGQVALNGDGPRQVELWASPLTAVAFEGGTQVGVLVALTVGWTADRRLTLSGIDGDGHPATWTATAPERIATHWPNSRISWPDGRVSVRADVTGSQYGVRISVDGEVTDLPGARLQSVGSQRWIVDGSERFLASAPGGCGCGGRRR